MKTYDTLKIVEQNMVLCIECEQNFNEIYNVSFGSSMMMFFFYYGYAYKITLVVHIPCLRE